MWAIDSGAARLIHPVEAWSHTTDNLVKKCFLLTFVLTLFSVTGMAQMNFVVGDLLLDAPQLASRGAYHIGVQTLNLVKPNSLDFVHITRGNPEPRYDRPLTVEVWYPAVIPPDKTEQVFYEDHLGRSDQPEPLIPFTFEGRALRDATPDPADGPYPLVIVSHGFLGSRFMMTYLTENLASKGYVVVAIDHTDSTYTDAGPFASTLLNRATDQLFVLDAIAKAGVGNGFLGGLVDAEHTALIGYSMGGYDLHPVTSPDGVRVEPVLQKQPGPDSLSYYADADDCTPAAIPRSRFGLHAHRQRPNVSGNRSETSR